MNPIDKFIEEAIRDITKVSVAPASKSEVKRILEVLATALIEVGRKEGINTIREELDKRGILYNADIFIKALTPNHE